MRNSSIFGVTFADDGRHNNKIDLLMYKARAPMIKPPCLFVMETRAVKVCKAFIIFICINCCSHLHIIINHEQ